MDLSIVSQWLARVPVRFEEPWWLLGLLTVPISMLISARSVAGMARWRRRVALAVRIVVLAALVMALAGMHVLKARDSLCILFLVDGSRSVGEVQRDLAMDFIRTATEGMRRGKDQMGIIVFGDEAHMEASPSLSPEVSRIETVLNPDQTDISQAIRLALASFPEDSAKRIVLLSDGNETLGRAIDEARVAQANDVRIDVVTLHKAYDKEVAIEQLLLPPRVKIGEPFELKVVASSLASGSGTFYVYRNKQLYGQKAVDLAPGTNVFRLRQSLDQAGFWTYDVRFVSEDDTLEENNRAMGFTHVAGAPRVLYCSMDLGADMYIPEALAAGCGGRPRRYVGHRELRRDHLLRRAGDGDEDLPDGAHPRRVPRSGRGLHDGRGGVQLRPGWILPDPHRGDPPRDHGYYPQGALPGDGASHRGGHEWIDGRDRGGQTQDRDRQ